MKEANEIHRFQNAINEIYIDIDSQERNVAPEVLSSDNIIMHNDDQINVNIEISSIDVNQTNILNSDDNFEELDFSEMKTIRDLLDETEDQYQRVKNKIFKPNPDISFKKSTAVQGLLWKIKDENLEVKRGFKLNKCFSFAKSSQLHEERKERVVSTQIV